MILCQSEDSLQEHVQLRHCRHDLEGVWKQPDTQLPVQGWDGMGWGGGMEEEREGRRERGGKERGKRGEGRGWDGMGRGDGGRERGKKRERREGERKERGGEGKGDIREGNTTLFRTSGIQYGTLKDTITLLYCPAFHKPFELTHTSP